MTALVVTVFLASLVGSLHCAGMCGPFVAFYAGGERGRGWRGGLAHLAYNSGRLLSYVALGLAAGALGAALDLAGTEFAGLQRVAAMLAGALIAGWGIVTLVRLAGVRLPALGTTTSLGRRVGAGLRAVASWPAAARALAIGLLSVLLPCGWLYAFVITAAGTGSPWKGALAMAAFWLGTVPIMAGVGAGIQVLFGPLRRHVPVVTAIVLVVVGIFAIAGRLPLVGVAHAAPPASLEEAQARAESAPNEEPSCCHGPR